MKSFLTTLLLMASLSAICQNRQLSGIVLDDSTQAIEYANVVLINPHDSSFIEGCVTNEKGYFLLNRPRVDSAYIKCSAIGYKTTYTSIEKGDTIILHPAIYSIDNVQVTASRPLYQMKGNSFVTNVKNSFLQNIGTANEVLKQLPGIISGEKALRYLAKAWQPSISTTSLYMI